MSTVLSTEIQAAKIRAAEVVALEARDYLVYGLAKAERRALMAEEDFCRFDYVEACKAEGIDWGGCF